MLAVSRDVAVTKNVTKQRFIFVHDPLSIGISFTEGELLSNVKYVAPSISYINDFVSYVLRVDSIRNAFVCFNSFRIRVKAIMRTFC